MSNDTDNDDVEVRIDPEEFLCGFTTPERAAMLALAFKTLTAYGYEGVVDEYITITRESESAPPEYVLGAVDDLINNIQKDAFRTHGISIRPGVSPALKDEILRGILAMQDYDDAEQLSKSLQLRDEMDNIEVLVDLLEEVGVGENIDDYAWVIASVSDAFINAVQAMLNDRMAEQRDSTVSGDNYLDDKAVQKLKDIAESAGDLPTIQMPTILGGVMPIGLPFGAYVGELAYRHAKEKSARVIAADLIMAADVSNDREADLVSMIGKYTDAFTDDTLFMAEIASSARAILGGVGVEPK